MNFKIFQKMGAFLYLAKFILQNCIDV